MNSIYKAFHFEDARELKRNKINFEQLLLNREEGYVEAMYSCSPDISLCDQRLPSFNSLAALKIIEAKKLFIRFIVMTATMTDDNAMSVVRESAELCFKRLFRKAASCSYQRWRKIPVKKLLNAAK